MRIILAQRDLGGTAFQEEEKLHKKEAARKRVASEAVLRAHVSGP